MKTQVSRCGGDGGVDASGQREDRVAVADHGAQLRDRLLDECGGRPVALRAAHVQHEVAQDLTSVRGVGDLGVELHAEAPRAIAHRRGGEAIGARGGVEAVGQPPDRVAVAHPRALRLGQAVEDARAVPQGDRRRAELALALRDDLAAFEDMGHEVHPVADAEDREAPVEDRGVDQGCAGLVYARRPAGQDHADHAARCQLAGGDVVREDLAVDAGLADAARDELDVLAAEIEDRDRLARRPSVTGGGPGDRVGARTGPFHLSTASPR